MPEYTIEVTSDARDDLAYFAAHERKTIAHGVRTQLAAEPTVETRNRKQLRDNPIGTWELRIGIYRVFYEVDEKGKQVIIISVGYKEHNKLYVRGKEVGL